MASRSAPGPASPPAPTPHGAGGNTTHHVFHFAGRPVAQLSVEDATETWRYLTTDHLGTPLVATDATGAELWAGPFEPFGRDRWAGTNLAAAAEGIFLRFPGQWDDEVWREATLGAEVYYNVHRWYQPSIGRYNRPDPLGRDGDAHPYLYALGSPLSFVDPAGERSRVCCVDIPSLPAVHCFINIERDGKSTTCGLHGGRFSDGEERHVGRVRRDKPFDDIEDPTANCGDWNEDCGTDECVIQRAASYSNPSQYNAVTGSNSNTFAGEIARDCGLKRPDGGWARGWNADPAKLKTGRKPIPSPCALP